MIKDGSNYLENYILVCSTRYRDKPFAPINCYKHPFKVPQCKHIL
jgi:hypothetical protein